MDGQTTSNDECGICLETLTAAITLPCTHTFCANCLDGWKSKFGSATKKERSKACPLCRKKIPPSKDMIVQLEFHRTHKRRMEAKGETTSEDYMIHVDQIKRLEGEIGDYEGEGIDYDGCIELPKYIVDAVSNDIKRVLDWLGTPVDMKRLNARCPDYMNTALVHAAAVIGGTDLLSILLQYGADVNTLNAKGRNPLTLIATTGENRFEHAKILLEWGVEMILPPDIVHSIQDISEQSNKDASFILQLELGLPS